MGVGLGEITTAIDPESSIPCDGPAFRRAKEALDSLHQDNYYQTLATRVGLKTEPLALVQELVNQSCLLGDQMVSGWKNKQIELATYQVMQYGYEKVPQVQLAKELDITPQQIFTTLKAMGLSAYLEAKDRSQTLLLKEIDAQL